MEGLVEYVGVKFRGKDLGNRNLGVFRVYMRF